MSVTILQNKKFKNLTYSQALILQAVRKLHSTPAEIYDYLLLINVKTSFEIIRRQLRALQKMNYIESFRLNGNQKTWRIKLK